MRFLWSARNWRHRMPFAHEPFGLPGCRAAIIVDPDGNRLGTHQCKQYPSIRSITDTVQIHQVLSFLS